MEPKITHLVDVIEIESGVIDQVYNYLDYHFATMPEMMARCYLDEPFTVSIRTIEKVPAPVLAYLRDRFHIVQQLTADGYVELK